MTEFKGRLMEGVLWVPLLDITDYLAVLSNQPEIDEFEASEALRWVIDQLWKGQTITD